MTTDTEKMNAFVKSMTKEQAREFIRKVMPTPTREITGEEFEKTMTMLRLIDPVKVSNNQRTETEVYHIGDDEYHVTYGFGDGPLLEIVIGWEDEDEL